MTMSLHARAGQGTGFMAHPMRRFVRRMPFALVERRVG